MPDPDLTHPGLDVDAVSADVDLGPERPPDHFANGHPAEPIDDDDEVT